MPHFFNLFLYALGYFLSVNFLQKLSDASLSGALLCYLVLYIDKIREHDLSHRKHLALFNQLFWLFSLPIMSLVILHSNHHIVVVTSWLALQFGMSVSEVYLHVFKEYEEEVYPVAIAELV